MAMQPDLLAEPASLPARAGSVGLDVFHLMPAGGLMCCCCACSRVARPGAAANSARHS